VVADGTSCRHQIADGLKVQAQHVAQILDLALSVPNQPDQKAEK
jgi:hypothetical protein